MSVLTRLTRDIPTCSDRFELRESYSDFLFWGFLPIFDMTSSLCLEKLCPTLHSGFLPVILVTFAEVSSAFAEEVKCLFRVWLPFPILLVNGACVDFLWRSV